MKTLRKPMIVLALAGLVFQAAGCAPRAAKSTSSGQVGVQRVKPAETPTLKMADDQAFQMAIGLHEPLPDYPVALVQADAAPQSVCVEIDLDVAGAVIAARALYQLPECPAARDALPAALVEASLAAVRSWRFIPAEVCHFPPGVEPNRNCIGAGVELKPVPIRLAYVFGFSVENGQARVAKRSSATR